MPKINDIMFINKKNSSLFLNLEKYSLYESANRSEVSYPYATEMLKKWAMDGLVYLNKSGKRYNVIYSPKGKRVAIALSTMIKIFKEESVQYDGNPS